MGLELKSLTQDTLLVAVARQLGLTDIATTTDELPTAVIASVLRRVAATSCPCSREVLIDSVVDAFTGFGRIEAVKQSVREVLDSLVVIGDLLELGGSTSLPGVMAEDWLYCSPPTFVIREGSILLLGIEPEDQASLPTSLRGRVIRQREWRYLRVDGDEEAIAEQLHTAGYIEISKVAWMRLPKPQTSEAFLESVVHRLNEQGGQGALEGLQVYGPANEIKHFASRLTSPAGHSGYYIGRRPQAFGSPIWVFVELDQGRPVRFMDLPWKGGKFRGCDHSWRIQSALDVRSGNPQTYSVVPMEGDVDRYEFFSPVPLWIERRLKTEGERIQIRGTLFAYLIDRHSDHDTDAMLRSYMWFEQAN